MILYDAHWVCSEFGVPRFTVLLRAHRLKFLQMVLKDPLHHDMFWTALLGKYEFEESAHTNLWSEQFCADLIDLKHFDGVQTLCDKLQNEFSEKKGQALRMLIQDQECKREFLKFDFRQYKVHAIRKPRNANFCL